MRRLLVALLAFFWVSTAYAATCTSCFWIGGTGTMDLSTDSAHWSTTTGGSSCGSPCTPTSTATLTFDGSSGGGTVTVAAGPFTIGSLVCGAFTGTIDFSVNNPSLTLSGAGGMNCSGAGTRSIKYGTSSWTLTETTAGAQTPWNLTTITGLTYTGTPNVTVNGSVANAIGNSRSFQGAGQAYGTLTVSGGPFTFVGSNTFTTVTLTGSDYVFVTSGSTQTMTSLSMTGSGSSNNMLATTSATSAATISITSGTPTLNWVGVRGMTFSGGATFTANNSFDLGGNSGITINPPVASGSGGGGIIGG